MKLKMGLPKLAEHVNLILPSATPEVNYVEEQLASRGLTVVSLDSSVDSFFSTVSLMITGVTTGNNDYTAAIHVNLKGEVCLSKGQVKPTVKFSSLESVEVPLIYQGEGIVTLLAGTKSPYEFHPESQVIAQHPRWRKYGEAGAVNLCVIPEDGRHVPPKRHVYKAYSLEEVTMLATVDSRVLAIHEIAGNKFFYCMIQWDGEGPRQHYLTLNPNSKGNSFENGVDALCRIIDNYHSMMGKDLQPHQVAAVV